MKTIKETHDELRSKAILAFEKANLPPDVEGRLKRIFENGLLLDTPEMEELLSLPAKAPELYRQPYGPKKEHQETIVDFMRRVWGPWIRAESLTLPALRELDNKAYMAIHNYKRTHGWPDDLHILSKSDLVRKRGELMRSDPSLQAKLRAARKLISAFQRSQP